MKQEHADLIASIPRGVAASQCAVLYELAQESTHGVVEIGSYRGKSTVALALGSKAGHQVPVFAVDPHEDYEGLPGPNGEPGYQFGAEDRRQFFQNILNCDCWDCVRLVNLPSTQAAASWVRPIDVLFIDGNHRYEAVKADCDAWLPHLVSGGQVVFHDALSHLPPYQVAQELIRDGHMEFVRQFEQVIILRKP